MASTNSTFPWKRNLAVLWFAQIITTLGFTFTLPFYPIFFQELGVDDVERAAFLAGVSGWVLGIGMGLFAPLWGIAGDRYGRKLNIVRAMVLGGAFLALSGYSQNATHLVVSRFFIGATSGVVPTIMALVAVHTPRHRLPLATGATMSALFMGTAIGPVFGGLIFDHYGMRASFWGTGLALFMAAVLVIALVREDFERPEALRHPLQPFTDLWRMSTSASFLPLLVLVALIMIGTLMVTPVLAGIVETAKGGTTSATSTGVVFMAVGVASAVSALTMGWLAGRIGLRFVFVGAAFMASASYAAPYFANSLLAITLTLAFASLFQGGLAGLLNGMIALRTPPGQHGAAFGASQVAHSVGVAVGPLTGGAAAVTFGLKSVFLVNVGVFAVILVIAAWLMGRAATTEAPATTNAST